MSEHRPGTVGIDYVVSDLLALVDELDLGRPHVMGFPSVRRWPSTWS